MLNGQVIFSCWLGKKKESLVKKCLCAIIRIQESSVVSFIWMEKCDTQGVTLIYIFEYC